LNLKRNLGRSDTWNPCRFYGLTLSCRDIRRTCRWVNARAARGSAFLEGLKLGNLEGLADLLLVKLGLKLGHSEGAVDELRLGQIEGAVDGLKLGHSEGAVDELRLGQIEGAVDGLKLGQNEGAVNELMPTLLEGLTLGVFEGLVDLLLVQLGVKLGLSEGFIFGVAV
jgi:hypothetical protein